VRGLATGGALERTMGGADPMALDPWIVVAIVALVVAALLLGGAWLMRPKQK